MKCQRCRHGGHEGRCADLVNGGRCVCVDPLPKNAYGDRLNWEVIHDQLAGDPDNPQLVAVTPKPHNGGQLVHVYMPNFRVGNRERHPKDSAFCGSIGVATTRYDIRGDCVRATGVEHWPMSAAAHELALPRAWLRWCSLCIGRAADRFTVLNETARLIVEADLKESS